MQKYRCRICGYVYDPSLGDIDRRYFPGTEFTELPKTWACPECGVSKGEFEPLPLNAAGSGGNA